MKYELIEGNNGFRRVKALKDFGDVKEGVIGGEICSEFNLSQEGNCWVYPDAIVLGNSMIAGNAKIRGGARVYGGLYEATTIKGNADIRAGSTVDDGAFISGDTVVQNAWIGRYAELHSTNDYLNVGDVTAYKKANSIVLCGEGEIEPLSVSTLNTEVKDLIEEYFSTEIDDRRCEIRNLLYTPIDNGTVDLHKLVDKLPEDKVLPAFEYLTELLNYKG